MADIILGKHSVKNVQPFTKGNTYTTFNEIFALINPDYYANEELEQPEGLVDSIKSFFNLVKTGSDPIFDEEDMLPFVMIHFF